MPLVALGLLFLVVFVVTVAQQAGHALWAVAILFLFVTLWAGQLLWHRRKLHELHGLQIDHGGRYSRVHKFQAWPKYCLDCGNRFWHWRETSIHDSQETSSCARLAAYRAELAGRPVPAGPSLPMTGWTADVQPKGPAPEAYQDDDQDAEQLGGALRDTLRQLLSGGPKQR